MPSPARPLFVARVAAAASCALRPEARTSPPPPDPADLRRAASDWHRVPARDREASPTSVKSIDSNALALVGGSEWAGVVGAAGLADEVGREGNRVEAANVVAAENEGVPRAGREVTVFSKKSVAPWFQPPDKNAVTAEEWGEGQGFLSRFGNSVHKKSVIVSSFHSGNARRAESKGPSGASGRAEPRAAAGKSGNLVNARKGRNAGDRHPLCRMSLDDRRTDGRSPGWIDGKWEAKERETGFRKKLSWLPFSRKKKYSRQEASERFI